MSTEELSVHKFFEGSKRKLNLLGVVDEGYTIHYSWIDHLPNMVRLSTSNLK